MQKTQFGQRGLSINGQAIDSVAVANGDIRTSDNEDRANLGMIAVVIVVALLFLAWFEALLSGTSLITPINQTLLWAMRGVGLVIGAVVTVLTVLTMGEVPLWKRGVTLLTVPFLFAFGIGEIAYRISDWAEFGFSSQPFEQAQFPIKSIHWGRKGARDTIQIDPFETGDATDIPINRDQYHELRDSGNYGCVTVMQRKSASGAVEIATNGRYAWSTPEEVPVEPCGGVAVSRKSSDSANPWAKD